MELIKNQSLCTDTGRLRLRLLDLGLARCTSQEWEASITSPGYSRLYYIAGGDPYITYEKNLIPLLPNHCYLIPTGFSFSHNCFTKMEQIYFHINLLNSNGYDILRNCKKPLSLSVEADTCERLRGYIESDEPTASLKLEGELMTALARLFEENNISPADIIHSPCVANAIDYIAKNVTIQLKPSTLAELSFVSLSTLSNRFKAEVGKPIGAYIDDIVFFEAEQLLKKGRDVASIQDISQQLGFCDQFYFSRRFKQKYGITPQQYRTTRII